ncbi:MAG: prolipoprotein diacylglyceryl transferase [Fibrobacteria bacterium]|nr:prolipoprotein diacylglyceryl transferase [Fibrobacteria bacterium]
MSTSLPLDWQHIQWHLDPVALQLGPLAIRWYGLMYAVAFTVCYLLVMRRLKRESWPFTREHIDQALTWMVVGVLVGGRLGYVFFYGWEHFSQHPLQILFPFSLEGGFHFTGISGMSYHGGLAGFAAAMILFGRKYKLDALRMSDLYVPAVPLGYTFGRLGNFLNGELWGRVSDVPWAVRFPADATNAGLGLPPPLRHPSQLYEAFGEGVLLWAILWSLRNRPWFHNRMLATYIMGYGIIRFVIEYTRQPDSQLGFVLGSLSMGQVLCLAMILVGAVLSLFPTRGQSVKV